MHFKNIILIAFTLFLIPALKSQVVCNFTHITTIENYKVYKHIPSGAILFRAKLAIDADGCPRAYGPNNSGLDWTANAGYTGNWWGVVTDVNGNPIIQGSGHPYPGMYVSTTSLVRSGYSNASPYRYVDSETIPYIALPTALRNLANISMGDLAYAKNINNGNSSYAYLADSGPANKLGEGSMKLASLLGINSNPRNGGTTSQIVDYVVFPQSGSGQGTHLTQSQIHSIGQSVLNAAGGLGLVNCLDATFAPCSPPVNDNCSSATTLTSNGAILSGTVKCATGSYGPNQCSGCNCTSQDDKDVYYKFVAQATSHTVTLSNYASNFDGVIELRTACALNTALGCYDPSGVPASVVKTFNGLTVGNTYYVRIYAWNYATSPPSSPTFKVKVTHTCTSPSNISSASYSGPQTVCSGDSKVYSVLPVTGATSYTWTLPSGWTGTSTSNSITATVGSSGGEVKVKANNTCGSSNLATKQVTVNNIPAVPGTITGSTTICENTTQTYSITPVSGATNYTWTFPSDWSYTGSSTSASINAIIGSNSGAVKVKAKNACGNSIDKVIQVNVGGIPAVPGVISGAVAVCESSHSTYSIAPVSGATNYTWTFPADWSYSGSSTSASIIAVIGTNSGEVKVKAKNTCGNSLDNSIQVNVVNMDTTVTVDNLELSSNATGVNYQWIDCSTMQAISGATAQVFTPSQNGIYAVILNQGNCSDTSACHQISTLGLSFYDSSISLVAYPNPTHDQIRVSVNGIVNEKHRITFHNAQGQLFIDEEFKVINQILDTDFDMSRMPNGLYFMTISSESLKHVFKVEKL